MWWFGEEREAVFGWGGGWGLWRVGVEWVGFWGGCGGGGGDGRAVREGEAVGTVVVVVVVVVVGHWTWQGEIGRAHV